MSNFRKAAPRRTHKERAQPSSRTHLGLLEKHSDYTQRARAYHSRQNQLNRLREAARLRNPDEFYHRMERGGEGMREGKHVLERGGGGVGGVGGKRSVEVYKRMKEQDRNYLVMELQKEKHTIQRMKDTLQGLTDAPSTVTSRRGGQEEKEAEDDDDEDDDTDDSDAGDRTSTTSTSTKRHVIFTSPSSPSTSTSSSTSSSPSTFNPAAYFNTLPTLLPLTHNRPTIPQLTTAPLPTTTLTSTALRHAEAQRAATYREVLQRERRAAEVGGELERVERQRLMMTKGRRRKKVVRDKFGDVVEKKSVFVWKQERKK